MENLLTVREAAKLLAVSPKTLYAWSEIGEIPCVKLVGSVRFSLADLQKWIEANKKGYNSKAGSVTCKPGKGVNKK